MITLSCYHDNILSYFPLKTSQNDYYYSLFERATALKNRSLPPQDIDVQLLSGLSTLAIF
jgi:hypothetical protein